MSINKRCRPGDDTDAYCTRCKMDLTHTILAIADAETPERVRCNTCGSEHRYIPERSAPRYVPARTETATREPRAAAPAVESDDPVSAIRELLEAAGAAPARRIGARWAGGTLVLKPGKPGLQEKEFPIDAFFKKIVMVRERLRVLEQHVNGSGLTDAEKLNLQQYITRCYGSLTTFNVLFEDREDWFVGEKSSGER